jgi:hypothetical protein
MHVICHAFKIDVWRWNRHFIVAIASPVTRCSRFLIISYYIVIKAFLHLLLRVLFFQQRIFNILLRCFCCLCMLKLKPRSWLACCDRLTLETMLGVVLLLKLYLMMRLWNEINLICWTQGWVVGCMNLLCGLMVGWRALIKCSITLLMSNRFNLCFHIECPNKNPTIPVLYHI